MAMFSQIGLSSLELVTAYISHFALFSVLTNVYGKGARNLAEFSYKSMFSLGLTCKDRRMRAALTTLGYPTIQVKTIFCNVPGALAYIVYKYRSLLLMPGKIILYFWLNKNRSSSEVIDQND